MTSSWQFYSRAVFYFAGLLPLNWMYDPAREHLSTLDSSEYRAAGS
jgi:hypothetical protein